MYIPNDPPDRQKKMAWIGSRLIGKHVPEAQTSFVGEVAG
jgi:hypothetical protein